MMMMIHAQRVCVVYTMHSTAQYAHKFTLYNSHPSTYNHILYTTHSHSRRSRSEILCYICEAFFSLFLFSIRRLILQLILTQHSMHKNVRGCFTANHHHLISSHLGSSQLTSFVRILCGHNAWP